ncbi:four helix bundle protein, partial [Candidatus Gracilibacteria bacterium]|nr:four helix bundle protein [Candidatus Gracilibacteria bacterium]
MQKNDNALQEKSYKFSLRIVNLYKFLVQEKNEYVLSKQVLRSGTSVGANVEESLGAQSDRDFLSKISISYKEGRETKFWIRLLRDSEYIDSKIAQSLIDDTEELLRIMGAIQIS